MKKLRKIIKEIIQEYHGINIPIKNISNNISKDIVINIQNQIKVNGDKINDGGVWSIVSETKSSQETKKETNIEMVKVDIDYQKSNINNVSGTFKTSKIKLLDDGSYSIEIKLDIKIEDITEEVKNKIKHIISHEMNHALVNVKNLHGNKKSSTLNLSNKITKRHLYDIIKNYPELELLSKMIYLSNPLEVQARVQETGSQLDDIDENNAEDALDALLRFQPLSDARNMMSYKTDEIKKIDNEVLIIFIEEFNKNIKSYSKGNPKTINKPDKFLNYWENIINNNGNKLARKIMKLVSDKYRIKEGFLYERTESNTYKWIFGEYF
jgi:hypothetical protein